MSINPLINNKGFQSYGPLLLSLSIHGVVLLTFTMIAKLHSFPLGAKVGEAIEMTVVPPQAATTTKPSTTAVVVKKPSPVIPSPPNPPKPTPPSSNNEVVTPTTQVTSTSGPTIESQEEQNSPTKIPSQQLMAKKEEKQSIEDELYEHEAFERESELTDSPNKPNPSTNNESSSSQTNIPVQDGRLLEQAPGNSPLSYPPQLRLKGITGSLVLSYSVTISGQVIQMKVLRSSGHKEFDQEATRKIATWRYKGGQEGAIVHPVFFKLSHFAR